VVVFVGLNELTGVDEPVSATLGGLVILGLRVMGIRRSWSLPPLRRSAHP
jgi:hypothetical protein